MPVSITAGLIPILEEQQPIIPTYTSTVCISNSSLQYFRYCRYLRSTSAISAIRNSLQQSTVYYIVSYFDLLFERHRHLEIFYLNIITTSGVSSRGPPFIVYLVCFTIPNQIDETVPGSFPVLPCLLIICIFILSTFNYYCYVLLVITCLLDLGLNGWGVK